MTRIAEPRGSMTATLVRIVPQVRTGARLKVVALALGALGATISMMGSWIPSLWGDEVASLTSANRSLPSLFTMLGNVDAVHGTYYLGLHAWVAVFGSSPFSLRLPSAFAVGIAVSGVVLIVDRLGTRRLAVVSGLVCCILPRITYLGEEARPFAFSAAAAVWLTYVLVKLLSSQKPPQALWVAYGLLLAIGTYTFLYVALLALAHLLVIGCVRASRPFVLAWATAAGSAFLAASPLVFFAITERAQIHYLVDKSQVTARSMIVALWFGNWWFAAVAWALIAISLGSVVRAWSTRRGAGRGHNPRPLPSVELLAAVWLFVPSVGLVLGQFVYPAFTARYLSFCAPAAAILIASGATRIARRSTWMTSIILVLVFGLALPVYLSQRGLYSKNGSDFAEVSATLGAHARTGDAVVFDRSVKVSHKPRLAMRAYPAGFAGLNDVTLKTPYYRNTSWLDVTYSVAQADSLGRFRGVATVWLIDYASSAAVDTYGVSDLEALGYVERPIVFSTRHSVIREFSKRAP